MKSLIIAIALCIVGTVAHAQFSTGVKMPLAIGDTILNTTTVSKVINATAGYPGSIIQVLATSQTGTVAGVARLFGSTDGGTTYDRINPTDSVILSATTLHYSFKVLGPLPPKIKVAVVGSGTQHTLIKVWYVLRKSITE